MAGYTARTFAEALLSRLGAPRSATNINAVMSWEQIEGGHWNNSARYNPLNTTLTMPGSKPYASGGSVQAYRSWQQGLNATVRTLQNYGGIVGALKQSDPRAFENAVASSPWGTQSFTVHHVTGYGGSSGPAGGQTAPAPGGGTVTVNTPTPQRLKQQPMTVKQYLDSPQIAQTYGYLAAYLHNKQIGPILAEAAKKGWGQDELLGALEKTKWWKNTAESTRSWQAQQRLDPATARQRLHQMQQQIQQLALSTLGSRLDPNRAAHMANAALSANWNQAQLQSAIGAEWHYQGAQAKYKGVAGQTVDQLQQLSQAYLVPVAHHEMQHWGRQILEGSTTVDDYKSYLQAQAESLYPTLTHALKSGQTVAQFADPYLQMASQILEKPVGDFNLFNPKWGKALNTVDDQGQRGPMSLADWGDYLRGLPDYRRTQQALQQGAAFSNSLLNIFGKVSTPNSVPSAAVGQ